MNGYGRRISFSTRRIHGWAEYALSAKPTQPAAYDPIASNVGSGEPAMSTTARGYFPHEPLFVEEDGEKLVVIEGNRRLAAVMLLLDPEIQKRLKISDLPSINAAAAKQLSLLPIVRTTREELWQYLGFKHVNGPCEVGFLRRGAIYRRRPPEFRRGS